MLRSMRLFLLIERHDHEHGHKRTTEPRRPHSCLACSSGVAFKIKSDPQNSQEAKETPSSRSASVLRGFLPEHHRHADVQQGSGMSAERKPHRALPAAQRKNDHTCKQSRIVRLPLE